ncbi:Undecaprenyl-phosphate alpha-N-acetylglucosaminyl 1-phosphate transferase [Serratia fonticola]|uniref:Undecaprenyl-phosphate alpha-N-acetylglucosaminyl 1-phosphate transferase n=1 Tax=Serratia fonticola TaxID=47917 RepID=A0A4U9VR65_SERFO|nr:Undecaprenyl-phosphate alpha-N-acetylglucosaminyl 1-phosphate transferase [Serratia fonticola]
MWRGFLPMLSCLIFFRDLLTVNLLTMSTEILFVFLFSLAFLFVARKAAKPIGLVDKPNYRKRHQGLIPLVGGISVYAGICFAFLITDQTIAHSKLYLTCAGVLVFVGAAGRSL